MNVIEVKSKLPLIAVQMAGMAVMEGVKACHKAQEVYDKESCKQAEGLPFSFTARYVWREAERVAAEVLFTLFVSNVHECMMAIESVAQNLNGFVGTKDQYFDGFVVAMGDSVRIREPGF